MRPAAIALSTVLMVCGTSAQAQPEQSAPDEPAAEQPKSDEESQATAAYSAGVEHFKAGRFTEAILEFNKAYRVDPNPVLVFNMARAFEELKQYESAIEYYRRYLEMEPESEDAPSVADALRALELLRKSAAEPVTVNLTVTSEPDGARIYVDGREVGVSPLRVDVPVGRHFVAVEAAGFTRSSEEIELVEKVPFEHAVTLVPVAAPPPARKDGDTTAWVLVGIGAALLAGAAVTGAMAAGKNGELDELDDDAGNTSRNEYDAIQDDGRTLALTTDGLLLGGGASLITGGILLLRSDGEATASDPLNAPFAVGRTYELER